MARENDADPANSTNFGTMALPHRRSRCDRRADLEVDHRLSQLKTRDFIDIDATQYEVGDVQVDVDQHQFSQEFQAAYTSERLSGVAGLYYLKEDIQSHQEAFADNLLGPAFFNSGFLRTVDDDLTTKSYAAYVNGSFEIVPSVRLSAGLRYTKETKDYFRTTSSFFSLLPVFNATFAFAPPKGKWSDWSPMASIDWQVTPTTMLYARAAKGFKSGGFNGRANTAGEASAYDPESVWSYEAGFKTSIANQLRLNGAIFHSDYKDFQARIGDIDPTAPFPTPLLKVLNVGKMRIRGAELEANWTPVTGLLIDGQLGYLDAEYQEFADDRFPGGSRAFQTRPSLPMDASPRRSYAADSDRPLDYRGRQSPTNHVRRLRSTIRSSPTPTSLAPCRHDDRSRGLFQGLLVHDARRLRTADKHFALGLYGQNLTKKAYKTDAQEFSNIGNIRTVYYGAPRTVMLRLTARY